MSFLELKVLLQEPTSISYRKKSSAVKNLSNIMQENQKVGLFLPMQIKEMVNEEIKKRRYSVILIFCIFSVQFAIASIVYNLEIVSHFHLFWLVIFHVFTLISAIPQAGLSDNYGRKRHLTISSTCVLLSVFLLLAIHLATKALAADLHSFHLSFVTTLPICFLLGMAGNTIPIARAGIADLKIHNFRTAMGWSTVFIGFGWIVPVLLGLIFPPYGVLITSILTLTISIFIIRRFFFDPLDHPLNHKVSIFKTIYKSYKWFISMFLVTGGAAALIAYLFSETTFYQIYSLNEEGFVSTENKVVGLVMAFGYAFGVIMQWIIYCTDKVGIKFGTSFSFLILSLIFGFKIIFNEFLSSSYESYLVLIEGVLNFLFAFGFGFIVPSLFSLMASKISPHHAGRLFGAIDVTDTFALNCSSFLVLLKEVFDFNDNFVYTLILSFFGVSFVFYKLFLNRFSSYEKPS